MLQDEVKTSKKGLCCTCSTLKNMQDHRQYFLDHLHQIQSGELAKKMKISICQETCKNVSGNVIIIANKTMTIKKKLEATHMTMDRRMDKQIVVYSYHGILRSNEND